MNCALLWLLVTIGGAWCRGPALHLDPDANRNVSQLISSKDYPVEEYSLVTDDGYILGVQRIPHGKKGKAGGQPVFLMHGLLSSAADWVINSQNESLGFLLADAGYDVWLGNARGNTYSKRHVRLTPKDKAFWKFSFDEMIQYDLPTMLDFVLNATGDKRLYYVGHSQGTLILFGLLSQRPEYNDKIKVFAALGPVSTVGNITSPIRLIAPFTKEFREIFNLLGENEFLPNNRFMKFLAETLCVNKELRLVCESAIFLICGIDSKQINVTRLPVYISHTPAGTSTQNIAHFGQMVLSGKFQKYDFGKKANLRRYGQATPPVYNVSGVTAAVALFWSENDWLADPADVASLQTKLPHLVASFKVSEKQFTHLDFIIGMDAKDLVYKSLFKLLQHFKKI